MLYVINPEGAVACVINVGFGPGGNYDIDAMWDEWQWYQWRMIQMYRQMAFLIVIIIWYHFLVEYP